MENTEAICTKEALQYNFTNEGGIDYHYRFLKNIMGLWMIQEVKRNYNDQYSFSEFVELARATNHFHAIVHVDDDRFLKPANMIEEIQKACAETSQQVPQTPGEVARCVFDSLVASYVNAIEQIEVLFGKRYSKINIVGGGCQNELLNQLIADATNKEVFAGPMEATVIGNLLAQLMALGEVQSLEEARTIVQQSFAIKKYTPAQSYVN